MYRPFANLPQEKPAEQVTGEMSGPLSIMLNALPLKREDPPVFSAGYIVPKVWYE